MPKKITPKKKADLALMKACNYTNTEIAEELGVSERTIRRHLQEIKERAEEIGYHQAVIGTIIKASPSYLVRLTPLGKTPEEVLRGFEGGGEIDGRRSSRRDKPFKADC